MSTVNDILSQIIPICHTVQVIKGPEQKAQVSFSDQNLSVVLGFGAGVGVNVSHLLQKH